MRALLRGHTQQIADMRFAPSSKDDIIASFGIDGNLFVKRVVAADDAIDEQPLLQITVSPMPENSEGLAPRVRWWGKKLSRILWEKNKKIRTPFSRIIPHVSSFHDTRVSSSCLAFIRKTVVMDMIWPQNGENPD